MKNADFQYVGLSFSKEAFSAPCSSSMWKFQENFRVAVFTKKFESQMASGGTCVFFILYIKSIAICQPLSKTHEPHRRPIFFRLQLHELPKTPLVLYVYSHIIMVFSGKWVGKYVLGECNFWGLQCSTLDVYDWETVRLIAKYTSGGSLGLTLQGINEVVDL